MHRISSAYRIIAATCAAALLAAGCASSGGAPAGGAAPPTRHPVTITDPDLAFVVTTLQDWKDYGDAVVAVRVLDDRDDPATPKDPDENGGLLGRLADVRITHVFWVRHPGNQPPPRFTTTVSGWFAKDTARTPIAVRGEPRFVPGHSYLVAVAHFAEGWGWLNGAGVPFDGDVVGRGEWTGHDPNATQPGVTQLIGDDAMHVQAALDAMHLSAAARRYDRLDPVTRAHRIAQARR